eukprot:919803-Pleurochrysis_carterae.AAC.2
MYEEVFWTLCAYTGERRARKVGTHAVHLVRRARVDEDCAPSSEDEWCAKKHCSIRAKISAAAASQEMPAAKCHSSPVDPPPSSSYYYFLWSFRAGLLTRRVPMFSMGRRADSRVVHAQAFAH